jgi:hypothetical protein
MRRPRIEDYDPNAKLPELASPIDGMPVIGKPPQKSKAAVLSPHGQEEQSKGIHPFSDRPQPRTGEKQNANGKKPANLQTRKRAKLSLAPALPDSEMAEKYTTHVEPSLVKKVQIEAIEQSINDYDVVRIALKEYFENHK